jgi:hypothetical protein
MIHLPSRPIRQIISQWKSISPAGAARMICFLHTRQMLSKKQNSLLNETGSTCCHSTIWVRWIAKQFSRKRAICWNMVLKPTNKRKNCQLDDFWFFCQKISYIIICGYLGNSSWIRLIFSHHEDHKGKSHKFTFILSCPSCPSWLYMRRLSFMHNSKRVNLQILKHNRRISIGGGSVLINFIIYFRYIRLEMTADFFKLFAIEIRLV